jgi:uncharacterized protein YxjI
MTAMEITFPVRLTFKILALAPQISVRDANDREILYVQQKLFKLKESIQVYTDRSKSDLAFQIDADRVIDFNAKYTFTDPSGQVLGSVRREGVRSLWKARYQVADAAGRDEMVIEEGNAWIKFLDGLLGEIPILGILTGYLLNPTYDVEPPGGGSPFLEVSKKRTLLESLFTIERQDGFARPDEAATTRALLGILMMVLLERSRG